MTVIDIDGGPRIERPDEPVELREGLKAALLAGKDWREGFSDDICIGIWLWGRWQPALEPAGFSRDDFVETVVAYRRELWLWLIGDRVWEQFIDGLVGRIGRRLGTASV